MRAFARGLQALALLPGLLKDFSWNEERLAASISPELFATDLATDLAVQGTPFREAYRKVADSLPDMAGSDPQKSLSERISPGGCGQLVLGILRARLEKLKTE